MADKGSGDGRGLVFGRPWRAMAGQGRAWQGMARHGRSHTEMAYLLLHLNSHLVTRAINLPVNNSTVVMAGEWWLAACQQMAVVAGHDRAWHGSS